MCKGTPVRRHAQQILHDASLPGLWERVLRQEGLLLVQIMQVHVAAMRH